MEIKNITQPAYSSYKTTSWKKKLNSLSSRDLCCFPSHLSADVLGFLGELVRVLLLVLTNSSVHLLPLHTLFALAEGRLSLYHLEDQASESPPVGADGVALVLDHLGSWEEFRRSDISADWLETRKSKVMSLEIKLASYPCILQCPLALVSSLLQGSEQQDPGLKFECDLDKMKKRKKTDLSQCRALKSAYNAHFWLKETWYWK